MALARKFLKIGAWPNPYKKKVEEVKVRASFEALFNLMPSPPLVRDEFICFVKSWTNLTGYKSLCSKGGYVVI